MRNNKTEFCIVLLFVFVFTGLQAQTVKDIDGNVYKTVTIGKQVWMTENLKTTKYRNGDIIGTTTPDTLDIESESQAKYQWAYDGNESNVATYGRLYTWYAICDLRKICPTGWHVPTNAEWTTLTTYLGGERVAGGKLKEVGTTHWQSPNAGATNESGFTALPSGYRAYFGAYNHIGREGYWWSYTESSTTYAYSYGMLCDSSDVSRDYFYMQNGFSVRCLRD